ncbi:MAG TPA: hypothetical protein VGI20_15030 [Rhizomicrobium sp.]|jgi:hypothetical protein
MRKMLSITTASIISAIFMMSPSFAASPSLAQIYGQIDADGSLEAGSVGISQVIRKATGHYCILPTMTALKNAEAAGTLAPQLTPNQGNLGIYGVAIQGSFLNCGSNSWIGVEIVSGLTATDGYFVILFE